MNDAGSSPTGLVTVELTVKACRFWGHLREALSAAEGYVRKERDQAELGEITAVVEDMGND